MAITITQQPSTHYPAFNEQWFCATSTQTGQPNFKFYITLTVTYWTGAAYATTSAFIRRFNNPPDSILRFDASNDTKKFIESYLTFNVNNFQQPKNSILKIVVNVGEEYGSTPAVYSGSNITYYVWNGVLKHFDIPNYLSTNYVCQNGSTFPLLNDFPDIRVSNYAQIFVSLLANGDNVIRHAIITSTTGGAFPITASFTINNALFSSGNWYDRYVYLNLSPSRLANLGGANWVALDGTTYTVDLYDGTSALRKSLSFIYYTNICTKQDSYMLTYLNSKGAWDFFNFERVSENMFDINSSKVSHQPWSDPAATGTLSTLRGNIPNGTDFLLTVQMQEKFKLRTDWLTEAQMSKLLDLASSPIVYLQDLNATGINIADTIYPVIITDKSFFKKKTFNEKLFNLTISVELAHKNNRQNGI